MSRVDEIVELLGRSRRGKTLDGDEQYAVAKALTAVTYPDGRVRGIAALEVQAGRPEDFEGAGRFSAVFRAILDPDRLTGAQREEMLVDLRVHDHYRATGDTIADYKAIRADKVKEVGALKRAEVREEVGERLKRIGFWKPKKEAFEGVVLIGLEEIPEHRRGKPRRELRQEFLYGIEHDNLLSIVIGSVVEGHLVQFEEYWGYRDWRSLTLDERLGVVLGAARGVEYLHRLNIVHRDIKPENVLVKGRKEPRAKVCDYGLIDSEDLGKHGVTKTEDGTAVGTILYMAPEQARGKPDKASDLFSLGGLLYTYLTERPPTPIPPDATRHQQSDQVLHRRTKPQELLKALEPKDRSEKGQLKRLSLVVAGCLQERPADRYPDVDALIEDLEAVRDGKDPARIKAHAKQQGIPLDLYQSAVFSPEDPFPDGEVVAELVGGDRPAARRTTGRRAALLFALLASILVAVWVIDPNGAGQQLEATVRELIAQLRATLPR